MAIWGSLKGDQAKQARSVLVIKLGGMSEFIQSLGAARIIRDHHRGARITLLTTEPFKAFAEKCPYFDVIDPDGRPREAAAIAQLVARIRSGKFDMVYDLERSGRTNNYFLALRPRPPSWSGTAPGCSHPYSAPEGQDIHPLDSLADQLVQAGVDRRRVYAGGQAPLPELGWVRMALRDPPRLQPEYFGLKGRYVMMIPGHSQHHPERRWPPEAYAALARRIVARGAVPVVIGSLAERDVGAAVSAAEPAAKNLVTRTDLFQIAALAERAAFAVGNDTGPLHIAAAAGAACLVLSPGGADPDRISPRGSKGVATLCATHLADLPPADVEQALRNLGAFGWPIKA